MGAPFPPMLFLENIYWALRFRQWLRGRRGEAVPYIRERSQLFAYLNGSILKGSAIDYLEFGVAEGESIREWARLNRYPGSRFFGFDSFEGLPEDWRGVFGRTAKGIFGRHGQPPEIENEPRVTWVVGLFQDTLPGFLQSFQPRGRLVVHLDADLYSSTLYVLAVISGILGPGTIVLFDDFSSFDDVFRALEDFASAFRRDYRVLAWGGPCCDQVAIEFQT
jgi:hypothetical protein